MYWIACPNQLPGKKYTKLCRPKPGLLNVSCGAGNFGKKFGLHAGDVSGNSQNEE